MKEFKYVIVDKIGIHARPAGLIANKAKEFVDTTIVIIKDGKSAELRKIMAVMSLGVKSGDTVTVQANGANEELAIKELEELFKRNL